jgi:hypothetical protein
MAFKEYIKSYEQELLESVIQFWARTLTYTNTIARAHVAQGRPWVKVKTYTIVVNLKETIKSVVWQAPVIFSLNTTESGVYNTLQLSEGWYTLNIFGPFQRFTSTWIPFGQMSTPCSYCYFHDVNKIDSYRVIVTVTMLSDVFKASSTCLVTK